MNRMAAKNRQSWRVQKYPFVTNSENDIKKLELLSLIVSCEFGTTVGIRGLFS
jgi:hypothetical protein